MILGQGKIRGIAPASGQGLLDKAVGGGIGDTGVPHKRRQERRSMDSLPVKR